VRCRGVRIFAVFLIAACANAPAPPSGQVAETTSPVAMMNPSVDPWSNTRADPYAVAAPPTPPRSPAPTIAGPTRTELVVDRTPAKRVAAISGTIELLAVTDDGRTAITADVSGSVRLWPTLDGKREPLVVTLPAPSMLAIARHDDAFAIASVDAIGQLQLVHATDTAEVTRRLDVGLARPVVALYATPAAFLALRDDRVVTLLDLDGAIRGELAAEPGEYLASVAVRDGAALALIEDEESVRGRWIDLAVAKWGATTKALPFRDGENVVLSSNHARVAGRRKRGNVIAIVALATGKIVDTFEAGADARAIGFHTDRQLVLQVGDGAWFSNNENDGFSARAFAFAKRQLFTDSDTAISIRSANAPIAHVGYKLSTITQMRPTKTGYLATDLRSIVELDASFKTRAGFSVADGAGGLEQLVLIDGERAIGFSYAENRSLYLFSTKSQASTLVADSVDRFEYEPKTRLLYYLQQGKHHIARFDTTAKVFERAAVVSENTSTFVLLDPLDRKGDEIAEIRALNQKYFVKTGRFDANGFTATREREAMPSQVWWDDSGDVRMSVRSSRVRAKSADGTMTAEIVGHRRLELREGKTVRWSVPSVGAFDLLWTPHGELVLFGAGMAKIDLATGALRDRQCGAWFGRWQNEPESFGTPSLCEVP
jgi:hypothetical protein